jgi:HEAT repeat protein
LNTLLSHFEAQHELETKKQILKEILHNYHDSAGPGLLKIASHTEDSQTKWMAIAAVGELEVREAAPFVVKCLHDDDPKVRGHAARALSRLNDSSAIPALIELTRNEHDPEVLKWTAATLGDLRAMDALPVLKSRANDGPVETRMTIITSIGTLGGRNEMPYLATFLDDKDPFVAMVAAKTMEGIARETDLDWCGKDPCGWDEHIRKVKTWWQQHSSTWK